MDEQQEYNLSTMDDQNDRPAIVQKSPGNDDIDNATTAKMNQSDNSAQWVQRSTSNQDIQYTGDENLPFQSDDNLVVQDSNDDTKQDQPVIDDNDSQAQMDDDDAAIPYQEQCVFIVICIHVVH